MTSKKDQSLDVNEALTQSEAFIIKYKKGILIALGVLVVLVGGFFLTKSFVWGPRSEQAATQLALGEKYMAMGDYAKALNGDGQFIGYAKIADQYSMTDAGNLAHLYAGICQAKSGKIKEAIKNLESYSTQGDALISPAALETLAHCYATDGQIDKAIETFKKAAKEADNNSISPDALIQAGILLESQNKKDEALKLYQEVKDKYVTSIQSQNVDAYIERVSK